MRKSAHMTVKKRQIITFRYNKMFCVGLIIGSNTKDRQSYIKEIVVEGHFAGDKQNLLVLYNYVPRDSPLHCSGQLQKKEALLLKIILVFNIN